jgi:hypothetical protein
LSCGLLNIFKYFYQNKYMLRNGFFWAAILFSTLTTYCKSQDTIYFKNGEIKPVKIVEAQKPNVKYMRPELPDGPVYVAPKRQIDRIVYSDGRIDSLAPPARVKKERGLWYQGHFFIETMATDLLFGLVSLQVERGVFSDHLLGRVLVSYGLNEANVMPVAFDLDGTFGLWEDKAWLYGKNIFGYFNNLKKYSVSGDLLFNTRGAGKVSYFAGISAGMGKFTHRSRVLTFDPTIPTYYRYDNGEYQSYFVKNGIKININRILSMTVTLGTGVNIATIPEVHYFQTYPLIRYSTERSRAFEGGISAGFRF